MSGDFVEAVTKRNVGCLRESGMAGGRGGVQEKGVPAGYEEREERKGRRWWSCGSRGGGESRDEPGRKRVGLHMVDTEYRNLPCCRKAFGGVEAGGETRAHTWAAGHRDEVWFHFGGELAGSGTERNGGVGGRAIATRVGKALEGFSNELCQIFLVRI